MRRIVYCFATMVLVAGLLLACAPTPTVRDIEILGGSSFNYYTSVATAEVLTKYNPYIRASAIETVGSQANVELSRDKDPNSFIFYNSSSVYLQSYLGVLEWKDLEPATDQKWICGLSVGHHGVATLNPKMKTLEDLDGKTLAVIPGLAMKTFLETAFDIAGINVTVKPMGFAEQYSALRDGVVDTAMWLSNGFPGMGRPYANVPPLQEVVQAKDVYGIPFPHDLLARTNQRLSELYGYPALYYPTIAPPGTLPTQTEPMEVYSLMVHGFFAKEAADEELIYDITKTIAENSGRLGEHFPALFGVTPALMVQLMTVGYLEGIDPEDEIHPGALRYYKEVGLWPEAWEKRGEVIK